MKLNIKPRTAMILDFLCWSGSSVLALWLGYPIVASIFAGVGIVVMSIETVMYKRMGAMSQVELDLDTQDQLRFQLSTMVGLMVLDAIDQTGSLDPATLAKHITDKTCEGQATEQQVADLMTTIEELVTIFLEDGDVDNEGKVSGSAKQMLFDMKDDIMAQPFIA